MAAVLTAAVLTIGVPAGHGGSGSVAAITCDPVLLPVALGMDPGLLVTA